MAQDKQKNAWVWFGLWLLSLIGLVVTLPIVPIQVIYRMFSKKYDNAYYFRQLAVGNDMMVGSTAYGSRHTVSAITGLKAYLHGVWHKKQEMFIDFWFGKKHCYKEAIDEKLIGENFR